VPPPGTKTLETVAKFFAGEEGSATSVSARREPAGLVFYSFEEPIALLDDKRETALYMELEWKYSRTTARHRNLLLAAARGRYEVRPLTREQIRERVGLDPTAPPPLIW
jgi:hypothetical protein